MDGILTHANALMAVAAAPDQPAEVEQEPLSLQAQALITTIPQLPDDDAQHVLEALREEMHDRQQREIAQVIADAAVAVEAVLAEVGFANFAVNVIRAGYGEVAMEHGRFSIKITDHHADVESPTTTQWQQFPLGEGTPPDWMLVKLRYCKDDKTGELGYSHHDSKVSMDPTAPMDFGELPLVCQVAKALWPHRARFIRERPKGYDFRFVTAMPQ